MENQEISKVVEDVVETGEEFVAEVVEESNGLVKLAYVAGGGVLVLGAIGLVKLGTKLFNNLKAKKKAEEKDITEIEIEEIPGEETKK